MPPTTPAIYYLGLPAWGFPGWAGEFFPPPTATQPALRHYASVFNTVEGNTTFYRIPDTGTARSWADAVSGTDFRFSFKLPRTITHQRHPSLEDLWVFMSAMEVLSDHLGPFLVQCPASLGPDDIARLQALFARLPAAHRYALELRHPDFFTRPEAIEPLLTRYRVGRVMFDSRPIYQGDRLHPEVVAARHKKPEVPLLDRVYNGLVYARVVLHPDTRHNVPFVDEWLNRVTTYLAAGHRVFFMMHCPNNQHCPAFARSFHEALRARLPDLPALPAWPVPQQESLF